MYIKSFYVLLTLIPIMFIVDLLLSMIFYGIPFTFRDPASFALVFFCIHFVFKIKETKPHWLSKYLNSRNKILLLLIVDMTLIAIQTIFARIETHN